MARPVDIAVVIVIRGEVGATGIAYRCDGPANASALVLINSLGTDHRMWDAQVDAFARDHRVIRFDFCGHGASDVPRRPVTMASLGDDVIALLDHLRIARAAVCGCSLGGMIALWLAAERSARITGVVLANTSMRIGTPASWDRRIDAVRRGGVAAVVDLVLARFFSDDFRARHPDVIAAVRDMLCATKPDGYIAACRVLGATDLRDAARSVRVPALVIGGALDVATPRADAEALHAAITGSRCVIIEGVAHLANIERADDFNAAVLPFLATLGLSGRSNG